FFRCQPVYGSGGGVPEAASDRKPAMSANTFLVPKELLEPVVAWFRPRQVILFGSVARGDAAADSDIDLLALNGCFVSIDAGAQAKNPYRGDAIAALSAMRRDAATILSSAYPAASVDDSPGKAVSLKGGSLGRKVDVVIGNWWDTALWKQHRQKIFRGVCVLDTKGPVQIRNKPFLHNFRIDQKDKQTSGLRKTIRLLKTLKYDADPELKISSYDIAAIAWNIPEAALTVPTGDYMALARNVRDELARMAIDEALRSRLRVPNGMRAVFGGGGATLGDLQKLHREIIELIGRVEVSMSGRFSKSSSASMRMVLPPWKEQRPRIVVEGFA
ncbi:MAG: nucleotidyltransferase domain-containing protein, partial [bacterium]